MIKKRAAADISDFFDHVLGDSDSDRSIALLCGALLDDDLSKIIENELNSDTHHLLRGALRSFGARIDLAYGLNWIDRNSYLDLRIIKDIRNAFAHFTDHQLTFDDQEVARSCNELFSSSAFLAEYERLYGRGYGGFTAQGTREMKRRYETPAGRFKISTGLVHEHLCAVLANGAGSQKTKPVESCALEFANALKMKAGPAT